MRMNFLKITVAAVLLGLSATAVAREIPKELLGTWASEYYYDEEGRASIEIKFNADGTGSAKTIWKNAAYKKNEDIKFYYAIDDNGKIDISGIMEDGSWTKYVTGNYCITGDILTTDAFGTKYLLRRKK